MTDTSKIGLAYDPICKRHDPGAGHPERPERIDAARAGVLALAEAAKIVEIRTRKATDAELTLCHHPEYIELVKREIVAGWPCLSSGDTEISAGSLEAALVAAGGVLAAVDAVVSARVQHAFCAVRPPGHHATPTRGMGFCIFNNVAIAARYAQRQHGIEKVLIVDWDVHHGNGTQEAFCDDPTVFYFSTHLWPFYPGTGHSSEIGAGKGKGTTMNYPLPVGAGRTEVLGAFREGLVPAMRKFRPQLVLISAGFDPLRGDPVGQMTLEPKDFADLTAIVTQIAAEYADGRLVSVLEGGYDLTGLTAAVSAHVTALLESGNRNAD